MAETLSNGFTFDQEVELAQLYWPAKWARARKAKQRHNLRKAAAHKCLADFYLLTGRTCGSCIHLNGTACELHSDFYGTVTIKTPEKQTCLAHTSSGS